MADVDSSFYSSECFNDTVSSSRYLIKRKPSTDSLRARLESLVDPANTKHRRQNSSNSPDKRHRSPRLVRISRKILKSKPQDVKAEESELKKITRDRLYWHRQQENARLAEQQPAPDPSLAASARDDHSPVIPKTKPATCFRPKHLALHQLNAIREQIQIIKQDLIHRDSDLPSPKPDDWFRQDEELDTQSDLAHSSGLHRRRASKIPQKSRALVERGVGSLHRKIKAIKHKTPHPASPDASQPISPSFTNFTNSVGTPDSHTDPSQAFSSCQVSPNSTSQPAPISPAPGTGQKTFCHTSSAKTNLLTVDASIAENDEAVDRETHSGSSVSPAAGDTGCSPATALPAQLSIVTQGLPQSGTSSASYVPLRPYIGVAGPVSPKYWPDTASVLPQWQNSAMEYLADDSTGQIDRWVFSSSLIAQSSDTTPRSRPSHRLSLDLPPRDSAAIQRQNSESESLCHPAFSPSRFTLVGAETSGSPFGSSVIQDPQYFVEKQKPSQVILGTDVLIEQQGGLSFLGKENFNERFRSQPWQTVKTIRQYNRPGRADAEYLPDTSRVAVVQTAHSTDTFPLPTPEWSCLTDFSIDKQTKPVDVNGWEYYDIFSRRWCANRHGCRTFIRRRRWVRVRGKLESSSVPNPAHIAFPSTRVSPTGETPCPELPGKCDPIDQPTEDIIVILRKQGVHQCITFNSLTVDGGHVLRFDLPGFPSLEVHWDDTALVAANPFFSSQIVAAEVVRYLSATSQQASGPGQLENQEEVPECLKDQLARINLQRVTKTTAGLSDPQKINLWRYWLESAPSSDPSVTEKPDTDDAWRVVDRHIEELQATFVFDFYRAQFMNMVVHLFSQSMNSAGPDQKRRRRAPKAVQQAEAPPAAAPTVASVPTFLKAGAPPRFLDLANARLVFWHNLATLVADPKHPHVRIAFVADLPLRTRLETAALIRMDLHKHLKNLNKLKRAGTSSK